MEKRERVARVKVTYKKKEPKFKELKNYTIKRVISPETYLRNYKIVKDYALFKNKLNERELEFLYFLYSEGIFKADIVDVFCESTLTTKYMFKKLINDGLIVTWYDPDTKERLVFYELSMKAKGIVRDIYAQLNDEKPIFTSTLLKTFMKGKRGRYSRIKKLEKLERHLRIKKQGTVRITKYTD